MNASNKTTLCHKTNGLKNMYELKASLKRQQQQGFKAILHISVLVIQHARLRTFTSKVFNCIPPRAVGHDKTWNSTLRNF